MKKLILVLAACTMAFLTGCTDPNYQIDDRHPVNQEVRLFENGIDFPVGSTIPIHLSDIIKIDESENPLLRMDANGYYSLHFGSSEPITRSVSVPSVRLSSIAADTDLLTTYEFPSGEVGTYNPAFSETLTLDSEYPFSWETDIPSEVVSISEVTVESTVDLYLSSPEGAYTIKQGSTIVFPATMTLTTADTRISISDGHTVTLLQDVHIDYGSNTSFRLTLTHIDTEGYFQPGTGKVSINENVRVTGAVTISGADFNRIPSAFGIYAKVNVSGAEVKELVGRFNVTASTNTVTYTLEGVPESLRNNDIFLTDPSLSVTIYNGSPFKFTVNSNITADIDGINSYTMDITDFVLAPGKSNVFSLPKEDAKYLTQQVPLRFVMGATSAISDSSTPVRVSSDDVYTYSVEYAFDAPLAFDSGTDIHYTTTIEDVKVDLGNSFKDSNVAFAFDLINTLPFNLDVDCSVVDSDGKPLDGVMINSPATIPAGSISSPSTTAINLDMSFTNAFGGFIPRIMMFFHGTVPAEYSGVVWHKDQYVKIENASIHTGPISSK